MILESKVELSDGVDLGYASHKFPYKVHCGRNSRCLMDVVISGHGPRGGFRYPEVRLAGVKLTGNARCRRNTVQASQSYLLDLQFSRSKKRTQCWGTQLTEKGGAGPSQLG